MASWLSGSLSELVLIIYVAAKATYIRLLFWQKKGFSALAP